jgi:cathepsin B
VNREIIDHVNTHPTASWIAGENENFKGMTKEQIQRLLGAKQRPKSQLSPKQQEMLKQKHALSKKPSNIQLPENFDSRTQWPNCPSIQSIRNQAECGSCWAFGAVESFTDRYCIAANQTQNPIFSAQYLVTCDENDNGCEGGMPMSAYEFIRDNGLVLESCQPYNIPTCPPQQQPCLNFVDTPACLSNCYGNTSQQMTLFYSRDAYSPTGWFGGAKDMQDDIIQFGPIEAAFSVYEDFLSYKSGVYQHTTGNLLGGHAIKIIGWGVENNLPYWLVANSWTTYWGDKGYFKILRGSDECGIEDDTAAGHPRVRTN